MDAAEFSALMNRFYEVATDVLSKSHAFIDKFVGDEVVGIYLPVFAGADHFRAAIDAAGELLRATGHGDPQGPWVPIGIGVHTGPAYFGTVQGAQGALADLTALGDSVNVAARLASNAAAGEALVSEAAAAAAGPPIRDLPRRDLQLKGRNEPVSVRVLSVS
jgi:adenylate cyclase